MNIKEFRSLPDMERAKLTVVYAVTHGIDPNSIHELTDEQVERLDEEAAQAFLEGLEQGMRDRAEIARKLQ